MSASTQFTDQKTVNNTQDRRLTTGAGDIVGLNDSPVSVSSGGVFSITSSDAEVAKAGLATAQSLAGASNAIAAQVADSQRAFVETATGQKTFIWVAAIIAAAVLFLFRKKL